jgi:hypothetical protein
MGKQVIACPLDRIAELADRTVYATEEAKTVAILASASSHALDASQTQPRVLVTGKTGQCGKSTLLYFAENICLNGWSSNPTSFALRAKFIEGPVTIFIHELSKIFGENGLRGATHPVYQIACDGYSVKGKLSLSNGTAQDISCYGVAFFAGIKKAAPDDLRSRCIIIEMAPKPESMYLEDILDEDVEAEALELQDVLHAWVRSEIKNLKAYNKALRGVHPRLTSRKAQIWGPLYAIAKAAGPVWVARWRRAFEMLALDDASRAPLMPEQKIVRDAGALIRSRPEDSVEPYLTSRELLEFCRNVDERLYPRLSDYKMAVLMARGLGKTNTLTFPDRHTQKGWYVCEVMEIVKEQEAALEPDEEEIPEPDEYDTFFDDVDEEVA